MHKSDIRLMSLSFYKLNIEEKFLDARQEILEIIKENSSKYKQKKEVGNISNSSENYHK